MRKITFYTKDNCSLCEEAYALLIMFQQEYAFELEEIDIYKDDTLLEELQLLIPAIRLNDDFLTCEEMSMEALERVLSKNFQLN